MRADEVFAASKRRLLRSRVMFRACFRNRRCSTTCFVSIFFSYLRRYSAPRNLWSRAFANSVSRPSLAKSSVLCKVDKINLKINFGKLKSSAKKDLIKFARCEEKKSTLYSSCEAKFLVEVEDTPRTHEFINIRIQIKIITVLNCCIM